MSEKDRGGSFKPGVLKRFVSAARPPSTLCVSSFECVQKQPGRTVFQPKKITRARIAHPQRGNPVAYPDQRTGSQVKKLAENGAKFYCAERC